MLLQKKIKFNKAYKTYKHSTHSIEMNGVMASGRMCSLHKTIEIITF